jgi:lipopolysaccharide export LptBFGC system permease protein LptF
VRKSATGISSKRFWISVVLLSICFAMVIARFIQIQIVAPWPFRLDDCQIQYVPKEGHLK